MRVCVCVNAAYFPDDLAKVTATSLQRRSNKVKAKEKKLFILHVHCAKSDANNYWRLLYYSI